MCILYKYRDISGANDPLKNKNLDRILKMLKNKQMYAAHFKDLNDPMEGFFSYTHGGVEDDYPARISSRKDKHNVLSLSCMYDNLLMWAYYADGLRGIVIGVSVENAKPVDYVDWDGFDVDRNIQEASDVVAQKILTKKLYLWEHEKEYRVFSQSKEVQVEIKEIIFGEHTDPEKKRLIQEAAGEHCPGINMSEMTLKKLKSKMGGPHSGFIDE